MSVGNEGAGAIEAYPFSMLINTDHMQFLRNAMSFVRLLNVCPVGLLVVINASPDRSVSALQLRFLLLIEAIVAASQCHQFRMGAQLNN